MTEQSPDYLHQDAKPEALRPADVTLPRYKIGYRSDEWGMGGSTPTGIPSPDGAWVRYEDAQAVATGYAAARLEIASLQEKIAHLANNLNVSNKNARDAEFASECHEKDLIVIAAAVPAEKYPDSKDWREGCTLERIQWLHSMYESSKSEVARLEAQLDAVGAGGVVPLRRAKCLHQIVEPHPFHYDEDLLEQLYWDFDDTRNKTGDERMTFKRKMRFYAHRMSFMPQPAPKTPAVGLVPTHWIESLPAMAREVFSNCYPAEIQKEIDDVIGWLASVIYVETCAKSQACTESQSVTPAVAQPTPPNPGGLKPDLANIDSPFNACMYQEHCKRWRDAAQASLGQPVAWLVDDAVAQTQYAVTNINDPQLIDDCTNNGAKVTPLYAVTAHKAVWLPADDTEGGAA